MNLIRFTALVLLIQGITPALLFGVWRPAGWFLLLVAGLYASVSWGLWHLKRWAWWLALCVTGLQVLGISSWPFSWQLVVGLSFGFGIIPEGAPWDMPLFKFQTVGDRFDGAILAYSRSLLASYSDLSSHTFLLVNFVAAALLALLLFARSEAAIDTPDA